MEQKLNYIVEAMLVITTTACFFLAIYVVLALSNIPK